MRTIKAGALGHRSFPFLACLMLILAGLWVCGQGCARMDQWSYEGRREDTLARQMKWAEEELERGNLHSAQTIFACVSRESAFPPLQERALFFSGLASLLNKGDMEKFEHGRKALVRASEVPTDSDLGRISGYLAVVFSEVASIMEAGEKQRAIMEQEIDRERFHRLELERVVKKQERRLLDRDKEIVALKKSLNLRNKEIKSIELKIKKLEEIHRAIKEKRESLS